MRVETSAAGARRGRSPWPWLLLSLLLAFSLGLIANPWFEREVRGLLPTALRAPPPEDPRLTVLAAQMQALAARPSGDAALAERVARLEARAEVTTPAMDAAAVTEARALFVLLGVRRALAYGQPLGAYEGAFGAIYGARDAASVAAVRALTTRPVTRWQLRAALPGLTATPTGVAAQPGGAWWERARAQLDDLVRVRRAEVRPHGDMAATQRFAAEALAAGRLDTAMAAVARLPATPARERWLADARRLQAAEAALSRLEALTLTSDAFAAPAREPASVSL